MSLVTLTAVVLAALLSLGALVGITEGAAARARAQTAADAAALAAVSAAPLAGGDGAGCAAARSVAASNGARLVRCEGPGAGWSLDAEIAVEVSGRGLLQPGVRAEAAAVLEPLAADPLLSP